MHFPVSEHTWRTAAQALSFRSCLPAWHVLPRSAQAFFGPQISAADFSRAFASKRQALRQWPSLLYQPRTSSAATHAVSDAVVAEPAAAPAPAAKFEALGLDDRVVVSQLNLAAAMVRS